MLTVALVRISLTVDDAWLVFRRSHVRVKNALLGSVILLERQPNRSQSRSAPVDGTLEEGVGFEPTYLFGDCPKCSPMNYPPGLSYSVDGGTRRVVRLRRTGRTRTCGLLIPDQLL